MILTKYEKQLGSLGVREVGSLVFFVVGCSLGCCLKFRATLVSVLIGFDNLEAVAEYSKLALLLMVSVRSRGMAFYE